MRREAKRPRRRNRGHGLLLLCLGRRQSFCERSGIQPRRRDNTPEGSGVSPNLTLTTGAQNVRKLLILRSSIQKVFTTLLTLRQGDSRPGCKFVGAAEAAEPGAVAAIAIDDPSQVAYSGE